MGDKQHVILLRGLAGAALGGALGYYASLWLVRHGLYAPLLPGAMAGGGAAVAAGRRCPSLGIACGFAGLALGILLEWRVFPFIVDGSFGYFIRHLHDLPPIKLILIGLGGVFGWWLGRGRA